MVLPVSVAGTSPFVREQGAKVVAAPQVPMTCPGVCAAVGAKVTAGVVLGVATLHVSQLGPTPEKLVTVPVADPLPRLLQVFGAVQS
jgi:hypothetical protein